MDAASRMKEVLGHPPRIEPLAQDELGAREWEVILRLRETIDFPRDAPVSPIFRTLCRHPDFFLTFLEPGIQFFSVSALTERDRELAILRTGWLCGAPFEFGEHVGRARRIGMTSEEIERVTQGSAAAGWDERDAAVLRAVEELHADAMIADATWAVLARHMDERQLIELPILIGHYHLAAFVQNSLRFALNPHNRDGLHAR
ncbi:MAG: carboxymuconolactone decarboxylase family protein [Novosphingobium sp.]|nr:carboxymuconolactone decarboxylase family protein [Novosphingobium sp.]